MTETEEFQPVATEAPAPIEPGPPAVRPGSLRPARDIWEDFKKLEAQREACLDEAKRLRQVVGQDYRALIEGREDAGALRAADELIGKAETLDTAINEARLDLTAATIREEREKAEADMREFVQCLDVDYLKAADTASRALDLACEAFAQMDQASHRAVRMMTLAKKAMPAQAKAIMVMEGRDMLANPHTHPVWTVIHLRTRGNIDCNSDFETNQRGPISELAREAVRLAKLNMAYALGVEED